MADVKICRVPGRVENAYEAHTVATAMQILDDETGESQLEVNQGLRQQIEQAQTKSEVSWSEYI